jgi:hypothetical protein
MPSLKSLRDLPTALGMPVSASGRPIVASFGGPQTPASEAEKPTTKGAGMLNLAKYREALDDLPDDASEEDVRAALVAAGFTAAPPTEPSVAPQPVAAAAAVPPGMIVLASSVWEQNQATIKTLSDFVAKTKRDEGNEVIAAAIVAGKFTPADKKLLSEQWELNPDMTRRFIEIATPNRALAVMASGYAGDVEGEEDDFDREIARLSPPKGKVA